jgi:hypothetical protein
VTGVVHVMGMAGLVTRINLRSVMGGVLSCYVVFHIRPLLKKLFPIYGLHFCSDESSHPSPNQSYRI